MKVTEKQLQKKGSLVKGGGPNSQKRLKCRPTTKVLQLWKQETEFIDGLFALLPANISDVDEHLEEYLLDLSDSEETKKREKFFKKTKTILGDFGVNGEVKEDSEGTAITNGHGTTADEPTLPPASKKGSSLSNKPTREELLERLHAKMALVAQKKNSTKAKVKREKKAAKKEQRKKDSKKQFISKTNPNLKTKSTAANPTIKPEPSLSNGEAERTPLRKPAVKKSDGQVVYSKFDFIAPPKHLKSDKGKPKVTQLLKTAEKAEGRIARLEASGKKSEAVQVSEGQKWITAIKRAQGDKVRDDPNLLKKTIKKQRKLKETSKKKWTERVENVEKQKELRVKKRTTNIQSRKDDKKKKQKKLQRKKGRIL